MRAFILTACLIGLLNCAAAAAPAPKAQEQGAVMKPAAVSAAAASSDGNKKAVVGAKHAAAKAGVAQKPLVKKPPLPKYFMRIPQATDFAVVSNNIGGYSVSLPKAFGGNPLELLPNAQGAMVVRTASDTLMCAANIIDPLDTVSFQSTQPLPEYPGKEVLLRWQHGTELLWQCALSRHKDYYGDKLLLEADAEQKGKTYQLLFVMPEKHYGTYLPQALYALNSFKIDA